MRIIYRIAKTELSTLFYSPVAWLVLVVFAFQTGIHFAAAEEHFDSLIQMGYRIGSLTVSFFPQGGAGGMFALVLQYLYLYIPLLTMGLMSREISSGSIKLLMSSPISIEEIILGKFLAMMLYGLVLMMIVLLFVIAGAFSIQSIDFGLVLAGLLGVYLVLCTYAAIGLFMSCLSGYQVVAAISTLAVLGTLSYVGTVGQKVAYLRDVTYFLSISGRASQMLYGLISSNDFLYFIIITTLFLGLAILKMKFTMQSRTLSFKTGRYVLLTSSALLLGYICSRPLLTVYGDTTRDKTMTLTPNSQKIIKGLKAPLTMTTYSNLLDAKGPWAYPEHMLEDLRVFEQYTRFMPDMKTNYVYYYDSCNWLKEMYAQKYPGLTLEATAKKIAKAQDVDFNMFLTPMEIRKQIDLGPEENRLVRTLQVGDKKVWLRMFDDMLGYPQEEQISSALKRMVVAPPKAAFLTGHEERSIELRGDKGYRQPALEVAFRQALINQGFDVYPLSIEDKPIPDEVSILVIADPRTAISAEDQKKISDYINRGGNLLIAGEPGKQDVLNPVIAPLGIQYMPGAIVQPSKDYAPDYSLNYFTKQARDLTKMYGLLYKINAIITMPGAMGIRSEGSSPFEVTPVLRTDSARAWNKLAKTVIDSTVKFVAADGDTRGAFTTAMSLKRKVGNKEQRIVVTGDADFMSNAEIFRRGGDFERLNFYYYEEICRWLSNDEFPVDVTRPDPKDDKLTIKTPGITVIRLLFVWIFPGLLIAFSTILLIRRKRK